MEGLFQIGFFLTLLLLGYIFGTRAEKKHYKSIQEREQQLNHVLLLSERFPPPHLISHQGHIVHGNVVISIDYFKRFIAGLRNLVGGKVSAYESLLDRARREAILRMQAQAKELNANAVINIKFETCNLSGNANKGLGAIEVMAYGTAMFNEQTSS